MPGQPKRATVGAVRCEDIRPDIDWAYLRGTATAVGENIPAERGGE